MTETSRNLVEVRNLAISFDSPAGKIQAVKDMSFRIRRGSCVAIVGESGSGKSVSARAMMGILPRNATIEQGQILFNEPKIMPGASAPPAPLDLAQLDPSSEAYRDIRGGRISIIFQEPMTSLSPVHTVGNQITEALRLHFELTDAAAEARCIEMLGLVRFPDPTRAYRSYPFELSGGLRQRAMIAMALVCGPALLIADEPTTALDVTVQAQILALMRDLRQDLDMAVLMITHDMGVVANVAEEVVVVYRGEVMESGMVEDVLTDPQHPYLKALLGAVPKISASVGSRERLKPLRDIEPVVGHLLKEETANSADGAPVAALPSDLLEVRDLTKRFTIRKNALSFSKKDDQVLTAVDRVSFEIKRGECLGLVGESGCGKTTVSKLIMGAMPADDGEIVLNTAEGAVPLHGKSDAQLVPFRRQMQYIFQDPFGSLNPRMTVYDVLSEPLGIHGIGDQTYRDELVREIMGLVGLDVRALNRYPHSFSGGQRQRIGIARALVLKPNLLICDEPVSALDVSTQAQVLNLLNDLRDKLGLTYLFISHDLAVVNYIADRIAVMCQGQLVELGPRDAIFTSPQHPYTRSLLASVPTVDLARPLEFETIREGLATQPENWSGAFAPREGALPRLVASGDGHFVRKYAS